MSEQPTVYFNNCRQRDHVFHYGKNAFFDLSSDYDESDIVVGCSCVVAAYTDDGQVKFDTYVLRSMRRKPDKRGTVLLVFFGDLQSTVTMAKAKAAKSKAYSKFFNSVGHFKRLSLVP